MSDDEYLALHVESPVPPKQGASQYTFSHDEEFVLIPHVQNGCNMFSLYHIPTTSHIHDFHVSRVLARPRISSSGRYILQGDRERNVIDVWSLSFDGTGGHVKNIQRIQTPVVSIEPAPSDDAFFLVSTAGW